MNTSTSDRPRTPTTDERLETRSAQELLRQVLQASQSGKLIGLNPALEEAIAQSVCRAPTGRYCLVGNGAMRRIHPASNPNRTLVILNTLDEHLPLRVLEMVNAEPPHVHQLC